MYTKKWISISAIIFFFFLYTIFSYAEVKKEELKPIDESKIENYLNLNKKTKLNNIVIKYRSNIQEHNIEEGKSYLYGNTFIEYLDTKIEADRIEFNWKNGDLYAIGKKENVIVIQKGDNRYYTSSRFHINLDNKKWNAENIYIQEKDYVIIAKDIKKENDYSLMKKVIYTADPFFMDKKDKNPDFYLKTDFLKYFHKKKAVITGPVFFYWYQVPIPIIFPFLYIPLKKNNSEISSFGITYPRFLIQNKKISVENIGFYFPISDYFNFIISSSIYGGERWKLETEMEYKLKYAYNGSIHFNYQYLSNKKFDYQIQWKHNKDYNSNSEIKFNADINYYFDNFSPIISRGNENEEMNISNISIKKIFQNYFLNMEAYIIQKRNKGETKLRIPEISISMRKKPFFTKNPFFYPLIMDYHIFAHNSIEYYSIPPLLKKIKQKTNIQTGINHTINIYTFIPIYPYLKISPRIHYKGYSTLNLNSWTSSLFQTTDALTDILFSSIEGFLELNNRSFLLRHKMSPIFSFRIKSYLPVNNDNKENFIKNRISFILNNNLELKIKNNKNLKEFSYKKIKIIDLFQVKNFYFFDKNSFHLEKFHFMGYTNFTKYLKMKYKGGINFYEKRKNSNFFHDRKEKKRMYFNFSFHGNFENEINFVDNKYEKKGKNRYEYFYFDKYNYAIYPIPLNLKIDLNSTYESSFKKKKLFNTFLSINGSINLTKYWNIEINTDYNLLRHKITFFKIVFYRDLRSFKMNFDWTPIGEDRYWSFFIGIKDQNLSNLLQYKEIHYY
ncbi:hypothetical protein DM815_03110 [Blattabacterium sp. (Cryptocercus kyebangensis)]|uniref:putative LPS assembly protein LptD n=1 Tax=Blattabacterium sp. (Cryptocercus kyebangensis) TaxID=298656 RepID=UPI000D7C6EE6|nr:putative LPS assembly protein LptD [Blattabacterium sp. (Cryptocercus kyebangensis)]AWU43984.1 hypothetical protein DM815_03110 [Blattabacterium sp. (Cryptocercus kyebangensis)]